MNEETITYALSVLLVATLFIGCIAGLVAMTRSESESIMSFQVE